MHESKKPEPVPPFTSKDAGLLIASIYAMIPASVFFIQPELLTTVYEYAEKTAVLEQIVAFCLEQGITEVHVITTLFIIAVAGFVGVTLQGISALAELDEEMRKQNIDL